MRDLIEMAYVCQKQPLISCHKCKSTPITECHNCEYYKECLLCEIICVYTGNTPLIIDYPTPTQIIYAEGE